MGSEVAQVDTVKIPLTTILKRWVDFFLLVLIAGYFMIIQTFTKHKKFTSEKRNGDVAVVTGGGRGIGLELVKYLLELEFHVIIGCRNVKSVQDKLEDVQSLIKSKGTFSIHRLDLCSLDSVRSFAEAVKSETNRVHVLFNNAGIMFSPYFRTIDGFESQFQVNYLSHFLLTELLIPILKETGTNEKHARIVNLSSIAHYYGTINFDTLHLQEKYSPFNAYGVSKQMQIMHAISLRSKWAIDDPSVNVDIFAVHPGVVRSELFTANPVGIVRIVSAIFSLFLITPEQGKDCAAFAGLSPSLTKEDGPFFINSKNAIPKKSVLNTDLQNELFILSNKLVNANNNQSPNIEPNKSLQTFRTVDLSPKDTTIIDI